MPRRKANRSRSQLLGVRMPVAKVTRLREIAAEEHRTVSQEVRYLIDRRIAEAEQQASAPAEAAA
jgi:predicted DNA-binding protein